jgi:intracellular septation protein
MAKTEPQAASPPLTKLLLDLGPLVLFFAMNALYGIFAATGIFMVTVVAALIASWFLYGKIETMPVVTAAFVMIFGGLTIYLQDETFIKMKPTVVYLLFAGILLAGLPLKRVFLKMLMGEAFSLTDEGWLQLTYRWAGFFVVMALLNEVVWRSVSTDSWVSFKVFGLFPLTLVFAALQMGLLKKHAKQAE